MRRILKIIRRNITKKVIFKKNIIRKIMGFISIIILFTSINGISC
jgi:hypothetical protein